MWDYSRVNLAIWQGEQCLHPPRMVEVAYMPELCRIPVAPVQDVDILFYGSINQRRLEVLQRIEAAGLKLLCVYGIYGVERDEIISRSKLVLKLHSHASELCQIVRVSYLLANAKAVVTENSPEIGYLTNAVAVAHRDDIVRTCRDLLEDDVKRRRLELRGHAMFSANSLLHTLSKAVRALSSGGGSGS